MWSGLQLLSSSATSAYFASQTTQQVLTTVIEYRVIKIRQISTRHLLNFRIGVFVPQLYNLCRSMAKAAVGGINGQSLESQHVDNKLEGLDDVIDGAKLLYELMTKDLRSLDYGKAGQRQKTPCAAAFEDQRAQQTSRERKRKNRSPLGTAETRQKWKNSLEDNGSRSYETDGSGDERNSVGETSRQDGPMLALDVGSKAPLAEPEDSAVTPEAELDVGLKFELLRCRTKTTDSDNYCEAASDEADCGSNQIDEDYDDVDGCPSANDFRDGGSLVTAAEEPVNEKEKLIEEIAFKLRTIGDTENCKIAAGESTRSASTVSLSMLAIDLISNLSYENFQDVVNRTMGCEPGVQQVTFVFRLATAALQHLGNGTKAAMDLDGITLNYFNNTLAPWVARSGGWDVIAQRL